MKFLIAGLGNPGQEYELTRHNIGFLVLDQLADKLGGNFTINRLAFSTEVKFQGKTLVLIKPVTYMNLSGKAVRLWMQAEKISKEHLLVVTDDIALPYGKLRMKPKGSNGGHNGLGSIQTILETDHYPRLRFGVGDNFAKGKQVDFVLGNFSPTEMADLPQHIDKAVEMILSFCAIGIDLTMGKFN